MTESTSAPAREGAGIQIFSGLGLGLFVGTIVGLSVSPVVSTILGALASVLAAFLSLQGGEATDEGWFSRLKMNGLRIGSFGLACVLGIFCGLFARSQDVFSSTLQEQIAKWTMAGYSKEEARQYVLYQKLGLVPEGRQVQLNEVQKAQSSSLFGELSAIDLCYELDPSRYDQEAQKILSAFRRQDHEKLTRLADQIQNLPAEQQTAVLTSVWEVLCDLQKGK